jgi:hypothetical protein
MWQLPTLRSFQDGLTADLNTKNSITKTFLKKT